MKISLFLLISVSISCVSCVSTSIATKDEVDHVNTRQANLGHDLASQGQRLDALQLELQQNSRDRENSVRNIHRQLRTLEENFVQLLENISSLKESLQAIQNDSHSSKAQMKKFEKKFDLVLDEVAKENERILQQIKKLYPKGPGFHVVKKGETLSKIAKRYGVTLDDIIDANDLSDIDQIYVGQKLRIPEE